MYLDHFPTHRVEYYWLTVEYSVDVQYLLIPPTVTSQVFISAHGAVLAISVMPTSISAKTLLKYIQ